MDGQCHGLNCVHQKQTNNQISKQIKSQSPILSSSESELIWKWVCCSCNYFKWGHTGLEWTLKPIWLCPCKREKTQREYSYGKNRDTGKMLCEAGGPDWSDASISWGMPRITGCHHKLREAHEEILPLYSQEKWTLD